MPTGSKRWAAVLVAAAVAWAVPGCSVSSERLEYDRGEKAEAGKAWDDAIGHFKNVVDKTAASDLSLKAAARAARIAYYETKKFPDAMRFYKHLVLYGTDEPGRIEAQKKIAEIDFEHLLDYEGAITEYQRLLDLPHEKSEGFAYRMAIARSYFYRSEFYQAQVELETILKQDSDPARAFDALLLKANILLTTKRLDDAIQALNEISRRFPERAREETIGLVLAVCYEEQKNYGKAIETLESIKKDYPRKQFIDNRIKTLRERQAMLPGAHGLHK
jgi:tetratricopeptide (TPR) repeat protein